MNLLIRFLLWVILLPVVAVGVVIYTVIELAIIFFDMPYDVWRVTGGELDIDEQSDT